jgi:hypothetical protein
MFWGRLRLTKGCFAENDVNDNDDELMYVTVGNKGIKPNRVGPEVNLEDARFEFRPGHQITEGFVAFLSLSRQMPG